MKKSTKDNISASINDKITALKAEKEKPIKLTKQVQLTLAKLFALKDVSDYQTVIDKQAELDKEWLALTGEFDCLEQEQQLTFTNKYQDITQQLTKIFAIKAESFEQQKIADALAREKQQVKDKIALGIQQHEQSLSDSIFKSNQIESIILSGDKNKKCIETEKVLQTKVIGELQPEDKLQKIESFKSKNTTFVTVTFGD